MKVTNSRKFVTFILSYLQFGQVLNNVINMAKHFRMILNKKVSNIDQNCKYNRTSINDSKNRYKIKH